MPEMRRETAEEQARDYARAMINSLKTANNELSGTYEPRIDPGKLEGTFYQLYLRHIAEHFVIVP